MLNKTALASDLTTLFTSPPATRADCASAWTDVYAAYAATAVSCSGGSPATLVAAKVTLQAALLAAFSGTNAATTSNAMATAFSAFWLLPPVVFTGPTPGAVIAVAGTALFQSGLLALWATNVADAASAVDAASGHADLFDILTKTVVVAHAPPSVCSAPLA